MKTMIKYAGGKTKELNEIKKFIPEYTGRYIEPFFGGGALFFDLEPSNAIINDLKEPLINFYKGIRNNYDVVKRELSALQNQYEKNRDEYEKNKSQNLNLKVENKNEAIYYKMRKMFNNEIPLEYEKATIYYYINKTAYSGMIRYNKKGKYNVPFGRYKNFNTNLITEAHRDLLQKADIYFGDYSKIFDMAKENDFMFLDPPYDCIFSNYGNKETENGFTEEMQRKLAKDFRKLKCKAMMVINKTPLIEELYGDLIVYEYQKSYAVNIKNRFKSEAVHVIITNY